MTIRAHLSAIVLVLLAVPATAQPLSRSEQARIDALVTRVLAESKVPSASIALVRDGRIVLAKAYGRASPAIAQARADLPYQIASNSKQFTAMALLALENDGKLSLDDKVAKWLPGISGGDRIALHQLLSHTAGLQDYATAGRGARSTMNPARAANIRTPATSSPGWSRRKPRACR